MANRREHMEYGGLAGALSYLLVMKARNQPADLRGLVISGLGGAVAATLPDEIEPANSGNHRNTFHSWTAAAGIGRIIAEAWENPQLSADQKAGIASIGAGYLSHLLLDSTTQKGLPLI